MNPEESVCVSGLEISSEDTSSIDDHNEDIANKVFAQLDKMEEDVETTKETENQLIAAWLQSIPRVGRNDPCFCNSGRKFKHCCLTRVRVAERRMREANNG